MYLHGQSAGSASVFSSKYLRINLDNATINATFNALSGRFAGLASFAHQ